MQTGLRLAICIVGAVAVLALTQTALAANAESVSAVVDADGYTAFIEQNAVTAAEADSAAQSGVGVGVRQTSDDANKDKKKPKKNKKKPTKPKPKKKKAKKPKRPPYLGGNVQFNRAMDVRGVLSAGSIMAQNATVQGTLIARQIKTKHIKTHTLSAGELKTTRLSSPTGTIVIEGDLLITHSRKLEFRKPKATNSTKHHKHKNAHKKAAKGVSFLAEEVIVKGVKQWALVRQEHFQHQPEGWHLVSSGEAVTATSHCGEHSHDAFLGGPCQLANGPVRKLFVHLPPHEQVRITARYHFIDNWQGETAYAQIDEQYVWTQSHRLPATASSSARGLQLCGSAQYPETRLSSPIDVSLPHASDVLSVAFGAHSANSGAATSLATEQEQACTRSFGIDDVAIYVR